MNNNDFQIITEPIVKEKHTLTTSIIANNHAFARTTSHISSDEDSDSEYSDNDELDRYRKPSRRRFDKSSNCSFTPEYETAIPSINSQSHMKINSEN